MSDPEFVLWLKVKTGDKNAFSVLFHKHYPVLCLLSKCYTNDMTTAREIVQDIFIYLWEHRRELEIKTSFKAYLAQAVRFNSIRRLDKDRKEGIRMDVLPEPEKNPEFHDNLEFAELQHSILKAIESLPEKCCRVFSLSRFDQLSHAEIAKKLNLSVKTVEAHITRALRIIQDHLNETMFIVFISLFFRYL